MRLLAHTIDVLSISTDTAATLNVGASWVDRTATSDIAGTTNTTLGSVATTTVVAAPTGANVYRNIRELTIANTDASTPCRMKVLHYNGSGTVQIYQAKLPPGFAAVMEEGSPVSPAWRIYDLAAQPMPCPATGVPTGIWLGTSNYNMVGTAIFTPSPWTTSIVVRGVGGGGAGGGCTNGGASTAAAAGGGSAGGYVEKWFVIATGMMPCFAYVGGGGTGVSASSGGNGVDSTFNCGAITLIAKGGRGATMATATGSISSYPGATGAIVGTNGDINTSGAPGRNGHLTVRQASSLGASGKGGDSLFGKGGDGRSTAGTGNNASGAGGGGGGAFTNASAAQIGGNGSLGFWTVDEYS